MGRRVASFLVLGLLFAPAAYAQLASQTALVGTVTDALNEQQKAGILAKIPTGAMGVGDDIGAAVAYLASKEAGYVTGQTLHVNGGMAMP